MISAAIRGIFTAGSDDEARERLAEVVERLQPTAPKVAQLLLDTESDLLVARLGPEVHGCIEMMSGAVWVRDSLQACGWTIDIADARKVKAIAPLACKTDRVERR